MQDVVSVPLGGLLLKIPSTSSGFNLSTKSLDWLKWITESLLNMKVKLCTSNEENYHHMKKMLVLNTIRLYLWICYYQFKRGNIYKGKLYEYHVNHSLIISWIQGIMCYYQLKKILLWVNLHHMHQPWFGHIACVGLHPKMEGNLLEECKESLLQKKRRDINFYSMKYHHIHPFITALIWDS